MFVSFKGSVWGILKWQWKYVLFYSVLATAVVAAKDFLKMEHLTIPVLPLTVVGGAIGIFVSFRTNSSYDRWWEGRKLWGRLINSSRHFCDQVLAYLPDENGPSPTQSSLVRRHIGYVHVLRCLLRNQDPFADADVQVFLTEEERKTLPGQSNLTHALLNIQQRALSKMATEGTLHELRLTSFDQTLGALLDIQGGCERIKKTPFPRGYVIISERLILAYGLLFPLGLVDTMGWFTIPITVLVVMSFLLIGEVGRTLEDPFTTFWPALPLFALSKTIEVNLRERLLEKDLPALPKPNAQGVLM